MVQGVISFYLLTVAVARNPGSLFVAATKDEFNDYSGVWLTEYDTRFYEWVHVAVTVNAYKMKIFVDGKYLRTTTLDKPSIKPLQVCTLSS
jgi:hypothetical protein